MNRNTLFHNIIQLLSKIDLRESIQLALSLFLTRSLELFMHVLLLLSEQAIKKIINNDINVMFCLEFFLQYLLECMGECRVVVKNTFLS